jgi:hybrid cluster-associated redox disulfide protein
MNIRKETPIHQVLNAHPETARFFSDLNMSCGGCFAVNFDTLENGAMMHGMDVNVIIQKLNRYIENLPASVPAQDAID